MTQDTGQCAYFDVAVHRNNAAFRTAAHDDVASGLAKLFEAETFQSPYDGGSGNVRELRHAQER